MRIIEERSWPAVKAPRGALHTAADFGAGARVDFLEPRGADGFSRAVRVLDFSPASGRSVIESLSRGGHCNFIIHRATTRGPAIREQLAQLGLRR